MAKYTVKHICGHTHEHVLFGKGTDRERKLTWLATVDCPECYKAKQQAEREAANQKAAEDNAAAGLPALVGTEKQIAWAETIRSKKIKSLNQLILELKEFIANPNSSEEDKATCSHCIKIVENHKAENSASWWIDNQHKEFDCYWLNDKLIASSAQKS